MFLPVKTCTWGIPRDSNRYHSDLRRYELMNDSMGQFFWCSHQWRILRMFVFDNHRLRMLHLHAFIYVSWSITLPAVHHHSVTLQMSLCTYIYIQETEKQVKSCTDILTKKFKSIRGTICLCCIFLWSWDRISKSTKCWSDGDVHDNGQVVLRSECSK